MVCGPSKAGTNDLHKNGKNVEWTDIQLIIPYGKWNNEIPSPSVFGEKAKRAPMVS
jgi:hypothetical protein